MDCRELVLKIEIGKYEAFKKACKDKGTVPATVLKRFMQDYVELSNVAQAQQEENEVSRELKFK